MSFTAIIPARFASSRFPGKALADIGGRPMVVRVADRARESGARGVYVATDHRDIAAAVERYGHQAVMTRGDSALGPGCVRAFHTGLAAGASLLPTYRHLCLSRRFPACLSAARTLAA